MQRLLFAWVWRWYSHLPALHNHFTILGTETRYAARSVSQYISDIYLKSRFATIARRAGKTRPTKPQHMISSSVIRSGRFIDKILIQHNIRNHYLNLHLIYRCWNQRYKFVGRLKNALPGRDPVCRFMDPVCTRDPLVWVKNARYVPACAWF